MKIRKLNEELNRLGFEPKENDLVVYLSPVGKHFHFIGRFIGIDEESKKAKVIPYAKTDGDEPSCSLVDGEEYTLVDYNQLIDGTKKLDAYIEKAEARLNALKEIKK